MAQRLIVTAISVPMVVTLPEHQKTMTGSITDLELSLMLFPVNR